MRARKADVQDYVKRDGVHVFYELYGSGSVTILVLPTRSILHSAHGRFQLVDLSRHYRVVTFDGRGNGRSDRPKGRAAYAGEEFLNRSPRRHIFAHVTFEVSKMGIWASGRDWLMIFRDVR